MSKAKPPKPPPSFAALVQAYFAEHLTQHRALPEATPVHEAERLQADLARAGIQPFAWVINQSLLASDTRNPLLAQRGHYEIPFIRCVADDLSSRCALIPWLSEPPIGAKVLAQLAE